MVMGAVALLASTGFVLSPDSIAVSGCTARISGSRFVLPPHIAHRQRSPQMNWLKKLYDPEDAMGRNVLAEDLSGGTAAPPAKQQKPRKPAPKPNPAAFSPRSKIRSSRKPLTSCSKPSAAPFRSSSAD